MYTHPYYPLQPFSVPLNRPSSISKKSPAVEPQENLRSHDVPQEGEMEGKESLVPFPRRVIAADARLLSDEILPSGVLLEFVPADILNAFINYVDLRAVITERDPEEDDRYINISNRFYTHFHEFGTVVHVVGASEDYWWYFCYDIDASDCAIGRTGRTEISLPEIVQWIYQRKVSGVYPVAEIDVRNLQGWRSFQ